MEIIQTDKSGIIILKLQGRLDTLSSSILEKKILELTAKPGLKLVLDFTNLEFISSSGLRVLLAAAKQMKSLGSKLILCALKDHVSEVFDVAGFTMLFTIHPSEQKALEEMLR